MIKSAALAWIAALAAQGEAPAAAPAEPPPPAPVVEAPVSPPATAQEPPPDEAPVATPVRKRRASPAAPSSEPSSSAGLRAAPVDEAQLTKAQALAAQLAALATDDDVAAKRLEEACSASGVDKLAELEPTLKARLRICRGRAAFKAGGARVDAALDLYAEGRKLAEALPADVGKRRIVGEALFRIGEARASRVGGAPSCGRELGLARLAEREGEEQRRRVEDAARAFHEVVKSGGKFWARRAAFRVAVLYDDFYRTHALAAVPMYRSVSLPSPFAVDSFDAATVLGNQLDPRRGSWPIEIAQLYEQVAGAGDIDEPDPDLMRTLAERTRAFGRLEPPAADLARNPWLDDLKPGVVRFTRRFEQRDAEGRWVGVDEPAAEAAARAALARGVEAVDSAYALVALASSGAGVDDADVLSALQSASPRVRLAGLAAAQRAPRSAALEALVRTFVNVPGLPAEGAPFATLQAALFGERERALLALRALAAHDRDCAQRILDDDRLPAAERVWIVAELGDARLVDRLARLANDREPRVAARAVYGVFTAGGKNATASLRPGAEGLVGCVSRELQALAAPGVAAPAAAKKPALDSKASTSVD